MLKGCQKRCGPDREDAEILAVQGLAFLAQDPRRMARFFALTGLEAHEVMERANTPELLAAVLEHLAGDESLLLVFAADAGVAPETIGPALAVLEQAAGADRDR